MSDRPKMTDAEAAEVLVQPEHIAKIRERADWPTYPWKYSGARDDLMALLYHLDEMRNAARHYRERAEAAEARVAELEAEAEKRADDYWHTVTVGQERMNAIVEQRDEARRALAESRGEVERLQQECRDRADCEQSLSRMLLEVQEERDTALQEAAELRAEVERLTAALAIMEAERDGWVDGEALEAALAGEGGQS